jgi:hypothetical protein
VVGSALTLTGLGDHGQALADYREAARLLTAHVENPAIIEWRELSAWSLLALGRRDEAAEVAVRHSYAAGAGARLARWASRCTRWP